jgi:hypothetical protein
MSSAHDDDPLGVETCRASDIRSSCKQVICIKAKKTQWLWSASELYRQSDRCLSAKFLQIESVAWSAQRIPTTATFPFK